MYLTPFQRVIGRSAELMKGGSIEDESLSNESITEFGTEAGNCNWYDGITHEYFPFSLQV